MAKEKRARKVAMEKEKGKKKGNKKDTTKINSVLLAWLYNILNCVLLPLLFLPLKLEKTT